MEKKNNIPENSLLIGRKKNKLIVYSSFALYFASIVLTVSTIPFNLQGVNNQLIIAVSCLIVGYALHLSSLSISSEHVNNELEIIENRIGDNLKLLESEIQKINSIGKNLGEINQNLLSFLQPRHLDLANSNPHLLAYYKATEKYALTHLKALNLNYQNLARGSWIEVSNPPIISDFLVNIVSSLDPIPHPCTWMGISRVVDPQGWAASNDPLFRFAEAIRTRSARDVNHPNKLHVFRIYAIESGREERIMNELLENLHKVHLKNELEYKLHIRLIFCPIPPSDCSIVFIPNSVTNNDKPMTPEIALEDINENGWKFAFGINWDIRNRAYVDGAKIHPGESNWVHDHYAQFRNLWRNGIEVSKDRPPVFDNSMIYYSA